jgi:predicted dithiol-disulfide oxidoreductase (DUF899 family)
MKTSSKERPKVVSPTEWEAARKELLIKEKQLTRQRDEVDRQRRELPWVKVEKEYVFEGPDGPERSRIFSPGAANSSCNISCSVPDGKKVAWAAPSKPTTSMRPCSTWMVTT